MKSIIPLVFIIIINVVLVHYECYAREPVTGSCEKICCNMQEKQGASDRNQTEAFTSCCEESTECVLPEHFYSLNCTEQLMNFCVSKNLSATTNLTNWAKQCCGNVKCSSVNNTRATETRTKCRFNITVDWREVNFLPKYDDLIQKWKKENWIFFLKMASQMCLNNGTSPVGQSLAKYKYPFYTKQQKHENKIVFGYQAPPAFLVKRKKHYTTFTAVGKSFCQLWVSIILCVTWTLISGVIIWLLDHRKNPQQFPSSFWKGIREGIWWAAVTMTTVGYGDKTPKSSLARIYSAVWMVIGMIILSMFAAEVASRLTSERLGSHSSILGEKVEVPPFSKHHFEEEIRGGRIIMEENSRDLVKHLKNKSEKMHCFVFHGCYESEADEDFHFVRALDKHIVGIKTNNPSLVKCVRTMTERHHGNDGLNNDEAQECENSEIDKFLHTRKKFHNLDDISLILYASVGLVVVMFVAGSVWDLMKEKDPLQKQKGDVEDNGSVGIDATEGAIEIRVIKEDDEEPL